MKTKLLLFFAVLLVSQYSSAQFYLNEVMLDPPGTDTPHNYIEIRGAANASLANTYVVTIEGDGSSNVGRVDEVVNISTFSTGTNGYFVAAQTGNFYNINSNAVVGLDLFSGDVESQSHTIMLIQSATTPSTGDDIDTDDDGVADGSTFTSWTVLDSVALLKDNDGSLEAYAYSQVVFLENNETTTPTVFSPMGATVVVTDGTQFDYVGRIGDSTGSVLSADETVSDWVGSDLPSSSTPSVAGDFWVMSSSGTNLRAYPESFEGSELNHIGGPNPSINTLSTNDFSVSYFSVYPNPASNFISIESSSKEKISTVQLLDVLGKEVINTELTNKQINVSNLSKGIYLLKINSLNGKSITKKIIIE